MSAPLPNPKSQASGRFVRVFALGIGGMLLLMCLVSGAWWFARFRSERARTHWKSGALERLASLSITNDTVRRELDELRMPKTKDSEFGWAHEHVLLMTNGESIIYEYRHGANVYFPPHLFIGHGSDGRWFYSSYHFCNSMNMVRWDNQPGSIAEFARRYSAREFDGKSDVCLKMTE